MNIKLIRYFSLLLLFVFSAAVFAKGGGDKKPAPANVLGSPSWTQFNINNITTWFENNGSSDINQNGNSGLVFPKGSNRTAAFQSGFIWGGKVDGQVRVGGSAYRQGTVPGRILPNGTAADPNADDVRIYRVRRDYKDPNADFKSEIAEGFDAASAFAQYDKDWKEWPASQGAPFEDVDGDGKYDPDKDIPGFPGADQTIWFVANDLDATKTDYMYGSLPMGIEEQVTIWGYNATGALGNMFFRKYIIINKNLSQKPFTEMFVSMWSDVDLGDAGDDFIGSDTTLSLMYFYNGKAVDAVYAPFPPPATGFDFFQGPMVAGSSTDTAIFKGKYKPGYKNLPMTGFYFFINPDPVYADPGQGNYTTGTLGFWNLFHGKVSTTGQQFTDPNTGKTTMFPLSGDPVKGTGWIDGQLHPPGDRRGGMTSGPFNMAYGDTQEIVVSEIVAGAVAGVDRLQAISLLKSYDYAAQIAYNRFFNLPRPPQAPVVTQSAFDKEIVLSWGSNGTAINTTEGYSNFGYNFEGYNVYQLPSASAQASEAIRIATFDIKNDVKKVIDVVLDQGVEVQKLVAFGDDTGIERSITITRDMFKGGLPLIDGSRYFFAVTAYAYNPSPLFGPKILENPITILSFGGQPGIVPHTPDPGVRYSSSAGDVINAAQTAGTGQGSVKVSVIDPSKTTGQAYKVTFVDDPNIIGSVLWTLLRGTTVLLKDQSNLSDNWTTQITDGLLVKVQGPVPGLKRDDLYSTDDQSKWGWKWAKGTRRFTWSNAAGLGFESFQGAVGWLSPRAYFGDGVMVVTAAEAKDVELRLAKVTDAGTLLNPAFDPADPNLSYGYRYMRGATGAPAKPEFAPYIINKVGGYSFQAFEPNVPLSAWDITNPATPKRLVVGFMENNVADGLVDGKYWPSDATLDNTASTGPREWLFIFDEAYSTTLNAANTAALYSANAPHRIMYWATWNRRGAAPFSPGTSGEDVLQLFSNKVITKNDVFQFTAPSVTTDPNLAKTDVQQINVFPNPYYGVNPQEINKYQRFVTFSHLPQNVTIRIFNLAGQIVRTLQKNTPDQFFRWDLQNDSQLPVASGLYVVYIDMPDLGTTKILKVAIVQEQQVLDKF